MRPFEQDWLELGGRVARSLHDQPPGTSGSRTPTGPIRARAEEVRL